LIREIEEACDLDRGLMSAGRCGFEILANGKQRRHWSPDDGNRILAEVSAGGAKVSDVAPKHGIAPSLIFAWRREARSKELGEPAAPGLQLLTSSFRAKLELGRSWRR
jgi:transposase-like protein